MSKKIIGFVYSTGNYEGYDYDNINMHCIDYERSDMIAGSAVQIIKIKRLDFYDVFIDFIESRYGSNVPEESVICSDLIGSRCKVLYARGGKHAADVRILEGGEK